jgi:uncharacterized protein YcbK (DUF882 family)
VTRHQLSEHFTVEEFDCHDANHTEVPDRYLPELERLCKTFLEPLRHQFGACKVHSGYRTTDWNRIVGGARLSFHVYTDRDPTAGVAADVEFARGSVADWRRRAVRIRRRHRAGKGGIGYYPRGGFVHIDSRDYAADWDGP